MRSPPLDWRWRLEGRQGTLGEKLERRIAQMKRPTSGSSSSTPRTTAFDSRRPASIISSSTRPTPTRIVVSTPRSTASPTVGSQRPGPRLQAVGAPPSSRSTSRHLRYRTPVANSGWRAVGRAVLPPSRPARERRPPRFRRLGGELRSHHTASNSPRRRLLPNADAVRPVPERPELLTLYRQVADVRTNDGPRPSGPILAGGQAETVVVELTMPRRLRGGPSHPGPNASATAVDPSEDNMLKVTGDGWACR